MARSSFDNFYKYAAIFASLIVVTITGTVTTLTYGKKIVKEAITEAMAEMKEKYDDLKKDHDALALKVSQNQSVISANSYRVDVLDGVVAGLVNYTNRRNGTEFLRPQDIETPTASNTNINPNQLRYKPQ